jgi:hypothetical protein
MPLVLRWKHDNMNHTCLLFDYFWENIHGIFVEYFFLNSNYFIKVRMLKFWQNFHFQKNKNTFTITFIA